MAFLSSVSTSLIMSVCHPVWGVYVGKRRWVIVCPVSDCSSWLSPSPAVFNPGPHPLIRCCNVWKRRKLCVCVFVREEERPEHTDVLQTLLLSVIGGLFSGFLQWGLGYKQLIFDLLLMRICMTLVWRNWLFCLGFMSSQLIWENSKWKWIVAILKRLQLKRYDADHGSIFLNHIV